MIKMLIIIIIIQMMVIYKIFKIMIKQKMQHKIQIIIKLKNKEYLDKL